MQLNYLDREMKTGNRFKKWASLKMAVIFIITLLLLQCKSGSSKQAVGELTEKLAEELAEIDVTKNYPKKEFYLQDIANVEYIPLETNNNTLMRFRQDAIVHVSDDYIIVQNYNESDIFVFDGQGKSKFSFNHRGQGPSEYNVLWDVAFDEKTKEIFVSDLYNPRIHVYDEEGKYKRTLAVSSDLHDIKLYNFDDETLLVYDETGVFGQGVDDRSYVNKPYLFMSKKDGSIVDSLNIHLPVRLSNAAVLRGEQDGVNLMYSVSIPIINNLSYGKNYLIADWSADTIYRLTPQKELQPMIVRKPPLQSTNPKILLSNSLVADKFILLGVHVKDDEVLISGRDISQKQLMYNFKTGEINEYKLKNKDISSSTDDVTIYGAITPENTGITMYETGFLFDLDEKGELSGDLKEVLKSLDAEDNPVLVKIKFFN